MDSPTHWNDVVEKWRRLNWAQALAEVRKEAVPLETVPVSSQSEGVGTDHHAAYGTFELRPLPPIAFENVVEADLGAG